jgi:hypothetical protein
MATAAGDKRSAIDAYSGRCVRRAPTQADARSVREHEGVLRALSGIGVGVRGRRGRQAGHRVRGDGTDPQGIGLLQIDVGDRLYVAELPTFANEGTPRTNATWQVGGFVRHGATLEVSYSVSGRWPRRPDEGFGRSLRAGNGFCPSGNAATTISMNARSRLLTSRREGCTMERSTSTP